MKKKNVIITVCLLVVILLAAAGCVLLWFYSPGVHKLFGYVHVEANETGYLYQNGEILGEIDFAINTTVPLSSYRENPDDKIYLKFGDLLFIDSPDPKYTFFATVLQGENGYSMHISGVAKEYESYNIDSNGAMTDIVLKYHSENYLYLDSDGNVLTFNHQPVDEDSSYMLVFTDDPVQASKDIMDAVN